MKMKIERATIKKLNEQIDKLVTKLEELEVDDASRDDYECRLEFLIEQRNNLLEGNKKPSYTGELISGVFYITGLLLVLNYEKLEVITGKAFSMVGRRI